MLIGKKRALSKAREKALWDMQLKIQLDLLDLKQPPGDRYKPPEDADDLKKYLKWLARIYDSNEGVAWLRTYKDHQDTVLYERVNFFALAISILMAVAMGMTNLYIQLAISVAGMILTCGWWLAVRRQRQVVEFARKQLLRIDISYNVNRKVREESYKSKFLISGQRILVHWVPVLMFVIWCLIAIEAFSKF